MLRSAIVPALLLLACSTGEKRRPIDAGPRPDVVVAADSDVDTGAPDTGVDAGADPDSGPPGDGSACEMADRAPYADRTTNMEFTAPADCTGCPGAFMGMAALESPMLAPGATTITLMGTSAGASRCEWWVLGGACGVTHGDLPVDPDGTGLFATEVPVFCGPNTIQVMCENSMGKRVIVRQIQGTECEGRDLRLTTSWGGGGRDWELHLIRNGGKINDMSDDCTWTTCIPSRMGILDWGVMGDATDNPVKDVDDTGESGPENIFLDNAPAGTYDVLIEHWSSFGSPSTGSLDVAVRETTIAHIERTMFQPHHVWYVGRVTFPAGTWETVDTVTDCNAMWGVRTQGCDMDLPVR